MKASSPPLVAFGAPLRGMDVRESRDPQSPVLLHNIDVSESGVWKDRPGLRRWAYNLGGKVMGLSVFSIYEHSILVAIYAHSSSSEMRMVILDLDSRLTSVPVPVPKLLYLRRLSDPSIDPSSGDSGSSSIHPEPYTEDHYYSFAQAGRSLYFCNGYGQYFRLEWSTNDIFTITGDDQALTVGVKNLIMSYREGGFSPSSLHHIFNQMFASGFRVPKEGPLSAPIPVDNDLNAEELIGPMRTSILVDPGVISVAHPGDAKSFPIEDKGAFIWMSDSEIVGMSSIQARIIVFTRNGISVIEGYPDASVMKISSHSLVSNRAHVRFGDWVFFVSDTGCFATDGITVNKVSAEMDPLWFSEKYPEITHSTHAKMRDTAYPFHVNLFALHHVHCVLDNERQQIMVFLPSQGFGDRPSMCWVWNFSDFMGGGQEAAGKWAIWSGKEELEQDAGNSKALTNTYSTKTTSGDCTGAGGVWVANAWSGTAHTGICKPPVDVSINPTTYSDAWHITAATSHEYGGKRRAILGTIDGRLSEVIGDYPDDGPYSTDTLSFRAFNVLIGLGRTGRVDADSRTIYTDVAIRKKQIFRNDEDTTDTVPNLVVSAQSEGEALHIVPTSNEYFDVTMDNMGIGTSRVSNSIIGTVDGEAIKVGALPTGTGSPIMSGEYHEAYARLNLPDDEARSIIVDIISEGTDGGSGASVNTTTAHKMKIVEVRIHGTVKGGAQRDGGNPSASGKVMT